MKKITSALILASLLLVPVLASADLQEPPTDVSIWVILENIVKWLFSILLVVAVIFIIIAGYYFVTAQGDPDKIAKARNIVLYALIGVVVAIAAYALVAMANEIAGQGKLWK